MVPLQRDNFGKKMRDDIGILSTQAYSEFDIVDFYVTILKNYQIWVIIFYISSKKLSISAFKRFVMKEIIN